MYLLSCSNLLTSNFALLYIFYVHLLAIRTRNASRLKHDHHLFSFIAFYHEFNFHTTIYSRLDRYRLNGISPESEQDMFEYPSCFTNSSIIFFLMDIKEPVSIYLYLPSATRYLIACLAFGSS